jgi:hypothetical protein
METACRVQPCVGDGVAFTELLQNATAHRYGIEIDADRTEQAQSLDIETLRGCPENYRAPRSSVRGPSGNGSIQASPWAPYVSENLNDDVKRRESFRHFAALHRQFSADQVELGLHPERSFVQKPEVQRTVRSSDA